MFNFVSLVDPKLMFNVEVKYGILRTNGVQEDPHPIELNLFVDKVLEVVFRSAKDRVVFFSRQVNFCHRGN